MQVSGWKKVLLGIIATVFLGALGSGLWDLALRPAGRWMGDGILTAATFGSSALKDKVYIEAAKGYHEASATESFEILTFWMILLCSPPLAIALVSSPKLLNAGGEVGSGEDAEARLCTLKRRARSRLKQLRILGGILFLELLFMAGPFFVDSLELNSANAAYTFFAQSMTICRPFLDDQESKMLESRFASIRGRSDYVSVTNDLRRIASEKQLRLPDFKPW